MDLLTSKVVAASVVDQVTKLLKLHLHACTMNTCTHDIIVLRLQLSLSSVMVLEDSVLRSICMICTKSILN